MPPDSHPSTAPSGVSLASLVDLTGKVALVTGAAQGFGFACARRLADAGASVVLADRRADRLEAARARLSDAGRVGGDCRRRRLGGGRRRAPDRRRRSSVRPPRRAREQRRRLLELPAGAPHARRVPAHSRRERRRHVPLHARGRRPHARPGRRRLDHQHQLDRRGASERLGPVALRHVEARDLGADQDDGARAGAGSASA